MAILMLQYHTCLHGLESADKLLYTLKEIIQIFHTEYLSIKLLFFYIIFSLNYCYFRQQCSVFLLNSGFFLSYLGDNIVLCLY